MRPKKNYFLTVAIFITCMLFPLMISAGDLEPPASPAPTMHTLEDIHAKLEAIETMLLLSRGRFIDNGDDTITDTKTNLIWYKNILAGEEKTYEEAQLMVSQIWTSFPNGSPADGWSLPTKDDLDSILDNRFVASPSDLALLNTEGTSKWIQDDPFHYFEVSSNQYFWTKTMASEPGGTSTTFWIGNIRTGEFDSIVPEGLANVWAVRPAIQ
jgi:Protein of unknown function (DUF1566)